MTAERIVMAEQEKPPPEANGIERYDTPTLKHWGPADEAFDGMSETPRDVVLEMGWGRLLFAHTYQDPGLLAEVLSEEHENKRDIGFYIRDPHVVLSLSPHQLFLDPSHTYRLDLGRTIDAPATAGYTIRRAESRRDAEGMNLIYSVHNMMTAENDFILEKKDDPAVLHFVAVDDRNGEVLGTATGIDHVDAFKDPEGGSSFWCLAVSPQAPYPGIGRALVEAVARVFRERGRKHMDLSVMYDNEEAIGLYERMGFVRVPVFCVKRKNPFNEPLYMAPASEIDKLNPYAEIIVNEARRRGITVDIIDAEHGYFSLSFGGRYIVCRESLTELTTAIAMSRCDDKRVTTRLLAAAGLKIPDQIEATSEEKAYAFLAEHKRVVVKPAQGEQGHGISVDVRTAGDLKEAILAARTYSDQVLVEKLVEGMDLRVIVIDFEVVAAAVRRPPVVVGTGRHTIRRLIEKQSRRRMAATGGESRIPLDSETQRCVELAGHDLDDTLPEGEQLQVRKTANLHTGGTIHDVTDKLGDSIRKAAVRAAQVLDIPVTGLDFITPDTEGDNYVIIEANERPGLANHEPQPTAERFIDMLFPNTAPEQRARVQHPRRHHT